METERQARLCWWRTAAETLSWPLTPQKTWISNQTWHQSKRSSVHSTGNTAGERTVLLDVLKTHLHIVHCTTTARYWIQNFYHSYKFYCTQTNLCLHCNFSRYFFHHYNIYFFLLLLNHRFQTNSTFVTTDTSSLLLVLLLHFKLPRLYHLKP